MHSNFNVEVINTEQEEKYWIFTISAELQNKQKEFKLYIFKNELILKNVNDEPVHLINIAREEMIKWIEDSESKLPNDKYRVLVNGGKITTNDINSFMSIQKNTSDLIRTNVTIAASLYEWAKQKAQNEGTSFSELVTRGLLILKDSGKEIYQWYKEQKILFQEKAKDRGYFEAFHFLPNSFEEMTSDELKSALQQSEINRTGWPIGTYLTRGDQRPHPQQDGIRAEYTNLILDYWYAKSKGEFYFARILESDNGHGEAEPKTALYFDTLIWKVGETLEHCISYYKNLKVNPNERVKIRISLHGLSGRKLSAWNPMRSFTLRHYLCESNDSVWEIEISLKELEINLDETVYESVKKLLIMFDFFVPSKEVVFDILNKEYRRSKS